MMMIVIMITTIITTMITGTRSLIKSFNFLKLLSTGGSFQASSVVSKYFTPRNKLCTLASNKRIYIENHIQKGLFENISGYVKHVETRSVTISNAFTKQLACVTTLLYLKNFFEEMNYNLPVETLQIYHVLDDIITLIKSLYTDYSISIIVDAYMTSPIKVQRGNLQGNVYHLYCLIYLLLTT